MDYGLVICGIAVEIRKHLVQQIHHPLSIIPSPFVVEFDAGGGIVHFYANTADNVV
jgi:hypothetical protein